MGRVLEQVKRCGSVDRVLVATDSERIAEVVRAYGGEAVMTPEGLKSGGDRVAFVAAMHPEAAWSERQVVSWGSDLIDLSLAGLKGRKSSRPPGKRIEKRGNRSQHIVQMFDKNAVRST